MYINSVSSQRSFWLRLHWLPGL